MGMSTMFYEICGGDPQPKASAKLLDMLEMSCVDSPKKANMANKMHDYDVATANPMDKAKLRTSAEYASRIPKQLFPISLSHTDAQRKAVAIFALEDESLRSSWIAAVEFPEKQVQLGIGAFCRGGSFLSIFSSSTKGSKDLPHSGTLKKARTWSNGQRPTLH